MNISDCGSPTKVIRRTDIAGLLTKIVMREFFSRPSRIRHLMLLVKQNSDRRGSRGGQVHKAMTDKGNAMSKSGVFQNLKRKKKSANGSII